MKNINDFVDYVTELGFREKFSVNNTKAFLLDYNFFIFCYYFYSNNESDFRKNFSFELSDSRKRKSYIYNINKACKSPSYIECVELANIEDLFYFIH